MIEQLFALVAAIAAAAAAVFRWQATRAKRRAEVAEAAARKATAQIRWQAHLQAHRDAVATRNAEDMARIEASLIAGQRNQMDPP